MNEILTIFQFARPVSFWLLTALPLLWLRFRDQRLVIIFWRSVILLLLVFALADPQTVSQQSKQEERIFAFDLSRSIPASMRAWMGKYTAERHVPNGQDRTFVFGAETREVTHGRDWLNEASSQESAVRPENTNLEKLFTTLMSLPPSPKNLFLFTDGWETQGNVEHLLSSLAGSGIKVYPILPAEQPKSNNVAVTKLLAPTYGNSGDALNLKVVVENQNDHEVDGTLTLVRNGQVFKTESIRLQPGSQIFNYPTVLSEGPTTVYRASFAARQREADRYLGDDQAVAWVTVKTKAKVLLLNGQAGGGRYLEEILRRLGFDVTSRTADTPPPPTGYGVVIFNNVEREKFSAGYLAAVERHVAAGNGFLMLGSEASFAPGNYRRTPIESLLPVEPKEQKREEKNRAVVLIIDKSGSMREDNRLLFAQEAAKAVARQLKDNDLLGVVGFDISPFVVIPLEPLGQIRGVLEEQIDRLKPGGRTYLLPAIIEAKRQLERRSAGRKHVIVLSDGETGGSGGDYVDLVSVMRDQLKITVSTVAIGAEANIPLMKRIAQYGGGFFHHTYDPSTLPQIVLQQIQDKPKDEPQNEKEFAPVQERSSELLTGFPVRSYPTIRGYMDTDLKRGAHLDLMIPRQDRKDPLMASWHYDRGKVVALTTDFEGRWSRNWIQWNELQNFWGTVFNWLRPHEEPIPLHDARVSLSPNGPILDLFLYEETSPDSRFRFTVSGKVPKAEGALKKLAPGHYEANLPISTPGDYRIDITEDLSSHRIAFPPIGYTLPFDLKGEFPRAEFNAPLLALLAQSSGGEINPKSFDGTKNQEITKTYKPIREALIGLAAILFLLEIALRKLAFSETN